MRAVARVRYVVGAGGVGTTTVAAATAVGLRERGRRVLLISVDAPIAPRLIDGTDLDTERIDSLALVEARYRMVTTVLTSLGRHDHGSGPSLLDPEELITVPAAQELAAVLEIYRHARSGRWDDVVVDCAGSATWRAILTVPSAIHGSVERIWPRHRRVVAATGSDARLAVLVEVLDRIDDAAVDAERALTDPSITEAVVVTRAQSLVSEATAAILAATVFHGVRVERVVANDLAPALGSVPVSALGTHPAVFWMDRRRAEQQAALTAFADRVAPLRIDGVSAQPTEPVGSDALGIIAGELDGSGLVAGSQPMIASTPSVALESGSGLESVYVMKIPLPLVDPTTVDVGRVEDDVVVSAQGGRRRLRLASVLRRCTVTAAELSDGVLSVRFAPDPDLWPAHLHAPVPPRGSDG